MTAGIDEVLERLVNDPEFRAQLARDPAAALAGYMLFDEDLEVLAAHVSADPGASGAVEQRTSKSGVAGLLSAFEPTGTSDPEWKYVSVRRFDEPPRDDLVGSENAGDDAGRTPSRWNFEQAWPSKVQEDPADLAVGQEDEDDLELTASESEEEIALLLPAVQRIRDAPPRDEQELDEMASLATAGDPDQPVVLGSAYNGPGPDDTDMTAEGDRLPREPAEQADDESHGGRLTYAWDFGDGGGAANDASPEELAAAKGPAAPEDADAARGQPKATVLGLVPGSTRPDPVNGPVGASDPELTVKSEEGEAPVPVSEPSGYLAAEGEAAPEGISEGETSPGGSPAGPTRGS